MNPPSEQAVQTQCQQFIDSLQAPAFIIIGWRKPDDEVDVVQCVKDMNAVEYFKSMSWAIHEVMKEV